MSHEQMQDINVSHAYFLLFDGVKQPFILFNYFIYLHAYMYVDVHIVCFLKINEPIYLQNF